MLFGNSSADSPAGAGAGAGAGEPQIEAPKALQFNYNPASLHPMAGLGGGLQYLDLESNAAKKGGLIASRDRLEDLSYGTGSMYLLSLAVGGVFGLAEGLRRTNENTPVKIRINTILNSITRRGPYLGNTAGVLTIAYNIIANGIELARGDVRDDAGTLAAGAITGAIYRLNKGPKPAAISAGLGLTAAAAWCGVRHAFGPSEEALSA